MSLAGNNTFVECLLKVSEKAANIARVCRQNQHLFQLLVQEKSNDEKNIRFLQDFKTLADVLIQEMVKHDIGAMFPAVAPYIRGEENNTFSNTLGDTITVQVTSTECETAELLAKVLNGDAQAAKLLAREVHQNIESIDQINIGSQPLPGNDLELPIGQFGIWIDPIDSTAEYIGGEEVQMIIDDVYPSGLSCVTVLIGVFDRVTGMPVLGIVNQPFHEQIDSVWSGQCHWGLHYESTSFTRRLSNLDARGAHRLFDTRPVVALSSSEDVALKSHLHHAGYRLVELAGAGYKLLCVARGLVDVYLLSKASTYRWDTCGPHALLRALGGGVVSYVPSVRRGTRIELDYKVTADKADSESADTGGGGACNRDGILAFRDTELAEKLIELLVVHE